MQNLEKKGFFRTIFIELLKADKIKNVIPNELQINQTKQELFLKYNFDQLKNKGFFKTGYLSYLPPLNRVNWHILENLYLLFLMLNI